MSDTAKRSVRRVQFEEEFDVAKNEICQHFDFLTESNEFFNYMKITEYDIGDPTQIPLMDLAIKTMREELITALDEQKRMKAMPARKDSTRNQRITNLVHKMAESLESTGVGEIEKVAFLESGTLKLEYFHHMRAMQKVAKKEMYDNGFSLGRLPDYMIYRAATISFRAGFLRGLANHAGDHRDARTWVFAAEAARATLG